MAVGVAVVTAPPFGGVSGSGGAFGGDAICVVGGG